MIKILSRPSLEPSWPEEAARDPEKLLNLCRLDDFWLDSNSLVRVSRLVSEENLVPLLESADAFVRETASVVLCAMRPERYLAGAECLLKPPFQLLLAIAKVAGDALLRPLALLASKGSPREFSSFLGSVITKLGTERARFFLDFYFDVMNEANFPPVRLVAMAQSSGSRSLSAKVVQCLREGKADFNSSINRKFPRQELLDELSLLLELYGISGAAEEILLDGEREFMKSGKYRRHEKSPRCDW